MILILLPVLSPFLSKYRTHKKIVVKRWWAAFFVLLWLGLFLFFGVLEMVRVFLLKPAVAAAAAVKCLLLSSILFFSYLDIKLQKKELKQKKERKLSHAHAHHAQQNKF